MSTYLHVVRDKRVKAKSQMASKYESFHLGSSVVVVVMGSKVASLGLAMVVGSVSGVEVGFELTLASHTTRKAPKTIHGRGAILQRLHDL